MTDATDPAAILGRIQELLDTHGMTANEASRAAGAAHIIPNIRKGSTPSIDNLVKLARVLRTTPAFLAFGIPEDDEPEALLRSPSFPPIATVPIIGEVAAGQFLAVDDEVDESPFHGVAVPPDPAFPIEDQFAAVTKGTSVNRTAPDGWILGCVSANRLPPSDRDLVVVERTMFGGQARERTAKRFRRTDDGYELWPDSTDPKHQEPIRIRRDQTDESTTITVLGVVTWVHRPLDRSERKRPD